MNEAQIKLARHALGFDEKVSVSYRNRYHVSQGGTGYEEWKDLEAKGLAEKTLVPTKENRRYYMFSLTLKGAMMALKPGESLDKEDFPDA